MGHLCTSNEDIYAVASQGLVWTVLGAPIREEERSDFVCYCCPTGACHMLVISNAELTGRPVDHVLLKKIPCTTLTDTATARTLLHQALKHPSSKRTTHPSRML
jgi:hypothetical protein